MGKRLGVSVLKLVLKIALISLCYDLFFVREFCLFRPGWAAERPPGRVDLTAARRVAEQLRKSAWDSLLDDHPIVPFFPAQDLERDLLHFRQLRKLHDVFAVEFHLAVLEIGVFLKYHEPSLQAFLPMPVIPISFVSPPSDPVNPVKKVRVSKWVSE